MTPKTPIRNARLAAQLAKPTLAMDTPTVISAMLNRLGKLERAQQAGIPDSVLQRLDELESQVKLLITSQELAAAFLHQEIQELRAAAVIDKKCPGIRYAGSLNEERHLWELLKDRLDFPIAVGPPVLLSSPPAMQPPMQPDQRVLPDDVQ